MTTLWKPVLLNFFLCVSVTILELFLLEERRNAWLDLTAVAWVIPVSLYVVIAISMKIYTKLQTSFWRKRIRDDAVWKEFEIVLFKLKFQIEAMTTLLVLTAYAPFCGLFLKNEIAFVLVALYIFFVLRPFNLFLDFIKAQMQLEHSHGLSAVSKCSADEILDIHIGMP